MRALLAGFFFFCGLGNTVAYGQKTGTDNGIRYAGSKAELSVYQVSEHTFEVLLSPVGSDGKTVQSPPSDILVAYPRTEIWKGRTISKELVRKAGIYTVKLRASPLAVQFYRADGKLVQEFSWVDRDSGAVVFKTPAPVYGLGEGGAFDHLDRRGFVHPMRDGNASYERATHGVYVAAPMLIGLDGWSLFFHQPINRGNVIDLRQGGRFIPAASALTQPMRFLVTCWEKPETIFSEYEKIAGKTPLPPKWALGYMQSHRTLSGPDEIFWVANNLRERNLPCDALIYLGTGFTPTGWNTGHNTFEFNRKIFTDPPGIIRQLKELNFDLVLHNYSPPRGLHGLSINDTPNNDTTDISSFWARHRATHQMGIDAWWADGGENLSAESRLARHRMYYLGPLHENPDVRPWSLHRTGYSGASRYGGWYWSGDPDSRWETLHTHIAVALNHSVSLSPYWGSDIGGFVPTNELTGELYIRWLQFSAFTPSFRGHGRTWHLRLPWGWDQGTVGPAESSVFDSENRDEINKNGYPYPEELKNGLIEPIARQYLNLRYQLLSYNYTLFRENYDTGLPPMRAMWIHYPDDPQTAGLDDQFLWGRNLLVAPVYEKGQTSRQLYLPAGDWYDFWTNERVKGGQRISRQTDLATLPLYVQAGTILPFDPVRQYTAQHVGEPLTIRIYQGANGSYTLYEDDGKSLTYLQDKGGWTHFDWDDATRTLTISPDEKDGPAALQRQLRIELLPAGLFKSANYQDGQTKITF